jgi:hypothetical protein
MILSSKLGKILNKVKRVRMKVRWHPERFKHFLPDSRLKLCGLKMRFNKLIARLNNDGSR